MSTLQSRVPPSWRTILKREFEQTYWDALEKFLQKERAEHQVFPPEEDVFNALEATDYAKTKVLVVGQDPYHDDGQAHGMAFSVRPGVKPPPSLVNIFKELEADLGIKRPRHGCLQAWAEQGVLLLNTVLTVRAHQPNSHRGRGWEQFTDAIIRAVGHKEDLVVFVLWGAHAQKKRGLIDTARHVVLESAHPSPLSAKNGFFGSKPFSAINQALTKAGKEPIDWNLPPV